MRFGLRVKRGSRVTTPQSIRIASPSQDQVVQRTSQSASLTRSKIHVVTPSTVTIECRVNGGNWFPVATASGVSVIDAVIAAPVGPVTLEARISGGPSASVSYFVGDVFALWGQSNISGRLTNNQAAPASNASMFGNDWKWKPLVDPLDSNAGQLDSVSSDSDSLGMGSIWPLVASQWLAATSVPIGFVPCAKGATGFGGSQPTWTPASNPFDRGTLFGSAMARVREAGPIRAVLWWQGEGGFDEVSGNTYVANWSAMASAMQAQFPRLKIMPCKIQECVGVLASRQVNGWNAIGRIWSELPTLAHVGPTLADAPVGAATNILTEVEGSQPQPWYHLKSDATALEAATRWASQLVSVFSTV